MNKVLLRNLHQICGRFALLAVLLLCVLGAKGQEGYWFFVNCNTDNGNSGYLGYYNADNFYMRPAEYWYNYNGTTANFTSDNGMPFITTYKTNQDEESSLWLVEQVSGQTYYTIKHVSSGKYLTVNDALTGYDANRMRVHLEDVSPVTDRNYFYIEQNNYTDPNGINSTTAYNIRCYNTYASGNNKYLNPSRGNKNQLTPTSDNSNTGGMIGFYTANNNGSRWAFEEVKPRISFTSDDKVQIAYPYYPTNATVYYTFTTDGTDPATPTTSSTVYSGPFDIAGASQITVKAFAVRNTDNHVTEMATFTSHVWPGSNRPYLFQNMGYQTTSHDGFYMQPGDVDNNSNTIVNTSSLARPLMKWHFKAAGVDNNYHYFYIVNPESGDYLFCNSSGAVSMKTSQDFNAESNDYKFRILVDASDGFRIVPKAKQNSWLYKNQGNNNTNAVSTTTTAANATNLECRWSFIPVFNNQMPSVTPPFTVSDNATAAYYTIGNANQTSYFIVPGSTNATTSNVTSDEMKWQFYDAGSDDWLNYYYIVNAVSGKYLYFCGDVSLTANNNAFQVVDFNSNDAERYKFVVAKTIESTKYYIVPKELKDLTYNNYSLVWRDGTNPLKTTAHRANNAGKWVFAPAQFTCVTPEITIDPLQATATITCATPGAKIYYVRYNSASGADPDLTDPTISATLTLYDGTPVDMGTYSYIKAIAARDANGGDQSAVAGAAFQCLTPNITFDYNTRILTISSTVGSTIYYTTDGVTNPTVNESIPHGTSPVTFSLNATTTIKAIAYRGEGTVSERAEETINKVATPGFYFDGVRVRITCATEGVRIYYEMGEEGSVPDPTESSMQYTYPITDVAGMVIKAIAVRDGWIKSDVAESGVLTPQCATPVIRRGVNNTFTIECSFPTEGVEIRYTTDGSTPNATSALYQDPVSISSYPITVKAIAIAAGYDDSEVATQTITENLEPIGGWYEIASAGDFNLFVSMANTDGAGYNYRVTDNFTVSNPAAITQTFTGTFDGGLYTISGMENPLFASTNGAIVRNVMLKDVTISKAGNVGAIVCEAKGYTRIYNCGILPTDASFPDGSHSSVTATGENGCAGSIVGKLEDDSRVVNCFSYADVSSTGYAAGIVGNNTYASNTMVVVGDDTQARYADLRTMVVNCMYYGDITAGSPIWPVYGGTKITNAGDYAINNYDFYSDSCHFASAFHDYNCSWPARYEYLTRYEFHRYLLNSNRELCGWWVGATSAPSTMSTTDVQNVPKDGSIMAKWVRDPAVAPYPILKASGKYSSPINIDADSLWRISANTWEGKKLGTLNVTVNPGDHAANGVTSKTLYDVVITDMDTLIGDYCYRKIQLPYYNNVFGNREGGTWTAKYAGNYTDYVVTGWEITSVTGGTAGQLLEDWQDGYNFADRDCTVKDQYRIFAQGGFYYVPNNVTDITIKAHWGNAFYLGNIDNYYDRVDFDHLLRSTANTVIRKNHKGTAFEPAGVRPALPNGKTIQTDSITAVGAACITAQASVYDNALVLVNNHQFCQGPYNIKLGDSKTLGFTIMSADFDFDDEPDYCLEWQLGQGTERQSICPIRFDFLPVEEIGLCLKKDGSTQYYSLGCYRPLGHYEVTETALIRFGQFEFSNKDRTLYAPIILNGGIYEQYVKSTRGNAFTGPDDKINYIILGGNVYMPSFTPGAHVNPNATYPTRHCAVNVMGGKIKNLYLTGNYNEGVTPNPDNPHCYIDGGWFEHVAAAGKEGINGNVTFKINHARINEFYGGGVMANHPVTGNIAVAVDSSRVYKYCGGPKFGDMTLDETHPENNKTVTTTAKGTFFIDYYGAGNGGTNYVQYFKTDGTYPQDNANFNWENTGLHNGNLSDYVPREYMDSITSYKANYEMEMINVSTGTKAENKVIRTYFYSAMYAATNTGPVSNTLTGCTVKRNFYGGGLLGGVFGDVTSELLNTEVYGSVFGAGYSASIPTVTIQNKDKAYPEIDIYTGYITPESEGTSTTYRWCDTLGSTDDPITENPNYNGEDQLHFFHTETPLVDLGTVHGTVTLTIKGNSTIGTLLENGTLKPKTGNVFGGGDESAVDGSIVVKLHDGTHVYGNVFGGGNEGAVSGDSSVTIEPAP